jgi:hypothetical protein
MFSLMHQYNRRYTKSKKSFEELTEWNYFILCHLKLTAEVAKIAGGKTEVQTLVNLDYISANLRSLQ